MGSWELLAGMARARRVPLMAGTGFVVTGLAFSFCWFPLSGHGSSWVQSRDLWSIYRSAQYVAWGDIGDIARSVTLPGIAVLLAPVALLAGSLGLSTAFPLALPHPTAWLILAPVELVLGALALLPLDALAVRHGIGGRRRLALCAAEALVLWPVVAVWGHPEDALAVAASVLAVMAASDCRWRHAGWWFGIAVAMQPFVLALLPLLVLGLVPRMRDRVLFLLRSAAPSAALLAIPLLRNWQLTTSTMFNQANYPSLDHPTPWLFLAPVLHPGHWATAERAFRVGSRFHVYRYQHWVGAVVGTGPGHLIALAVSVVVGLWAWRHRPSPEEALWLAAACLVLRCIFESVEDPFYVWPALAVVLVVAATRGGWRLPVVVAISVGLTVFAELHLSPWGWYAPVLAMLAVVLACAWPGGGLAAKRHARPGGGVAAVVASSLARVPART